MNVIMNTFSRLGNIQNIVPRILFNGTRSLSTVTENSSLETINESSTYEPDKLYKRLELEIKGNEPEVIKSYCWFATEAAKHLGIEVGDSWPLRKAFKERYTLLKSIHVHKKHRVQYEMRTYFHYIHFHKLTGSTCDTFLEYIERNLPEGVAMKVTKIEMQKLPEYMLPMAEKIKNSN